MSETEFSYVVDVVFSVKAILYYRFHQSLKHVNTYWTLETKRVYISDQLELYWGWFSLLFSRSVKQELDEYCTRVGWNLHRLIMEKWCYSCEILHSLNSTFFLLITTLPLFLSLKLISDSFLTDYVCWIHLYELDTER